MWIELNKRKSRCCRCRKPITLKYRVNNDKWFYHLSCYKERFDIQFKVYKSFKKEFNKQKYKRIMILERLE